MAALVAVTACAPIIHPPATPTGFHAPPRVTYTGVLTLDGALLPSDVATSTSAATIPASLVVDETSDLTAVVHVAPGCALDATIVSPSYVNVPGQGYVRRSDGALAVARPASCVIGGGSPATIGAGTIVVRGAAAVELAATGADDHGRPASLRFIGTLAAEDDVAETPPGAVDVDFTAELVTACPNCQLNHRPLDMPGRYPFEPTLERLAPDGASFRPVCKAPCTVWLQPRDQLRVAGTGLLPSTPFTLPEGRARLALKASATGEADRTFAWVFTGVGALEAAIGGGAAVVGAAESNPRTSRGLEIGGAVLLVSSLAFLIPAKLIFDHQGTTVTTDNPPR